MGHTVDRQIMDKENGRELSVEDYLKQVGTLLFVSLSLFSKCSIVDAARAPQTSCYCISRPWEERLGAW